MLKLANHLRSMELSNGMKPEKRYVSSAGRENACRICQCGCLTHAACLRPCHEKVRFPVILTFREKEIARRIVLVFKQFVCGFDILRVQEGHSVVSYVCDVNGWSFVKNSRYVCRLRGVSLRDVSLVLANKRCLTHSIDQKILRRLFADPLGTCPGPGQASRTLHLFHIGPADVKSIG